MILCIILLNEADWMLMINGTPSWSFSSQVPNPEYFQGKCWIVYSSAVWELESFCLHPRTRIRVEFVHTLFRVFFFSHLPQSFRRMVWWRSGFFFPFPGSSWCLFGLNGVLCSSLWPFLLTLSGGIRSRCCLFSVSSSDARLSRGSPRGIILLCWSSYLGAAKTRVKVCTWGLGRGTCPREPALCLPSSAAVLLMSPGGGGERTRDARMFRSSPRQMLDGQGLFSVRACPRPAVGEFNVILRLV